VVDFSGKKRRTYLAMFSYVLSARAHFPAARRRPEAGKTEIMATRVGSREKTNRRLHACMCFVASRQVVQVYGGFPDEDGAHGSSGSARLCVRPPCGTSTSFMEGEGEAGIVDV